MVGPNEKAMFTLALRQVRWEQLYRLPTCQEQFNMLQNTVHDLINTHFPTRTVEMHNKDKPWVTERFKQTVKQCQKAWQRGDMESYRKSRNVANRLGSSLQKLFYLRRKMRLHPADSSSWWRTIKCLLGGKRDSAAALEPLTKSTSKGNMRLLADKINDFFQSVAAHLPPLTADSPFLSAECNVPDKYVITADEVESRLACLNPGKVTGPDEIPTWVLRDFAPFLASPLCAVFNSSIREGYVPYLWRSAHIILLPQKNPPTLIESDLRPLSLTPVMSKVLEHFICRWVREAVAPNIHPRQLGAVQGSSAAHTLVKMLHYIQCNLDTPGQHVRMLLLDYSKAFDLVNHNILLEKMQRVGTPGSLVRWCAAFLLNRQQCVWVGCDLSDVVTLSGSAPQGTLLGPLAFILHLGDFDIYPWSGGGLHLRRWHQLLPCVQRPTRSTHSERSWLLGGLGQLQWHADQSGKDQGDGLLVLQISRFGTDHHWQQSNREGCPVQASWSHAVLGSVLEWAYWLCLVQVQPAPVLTVTPRRSGVPAVDLLTLYKATVWHSSPPEYLSEELEQVQQRALRIIFGEGSYKDHLEAAGLPTLFERRLLLCEAFYKKMNKPDNKLHHLLPTPKEHKYSLRHPRRLPDIPGHTKAFQKQLRAMGSARIWLISNVLMHGQRLGVWRPPPDQAQSHFDRPVRMLTVCTFLVRTFHNCCP